MFIILLIIGIIAGILAGLLGLGGGILFTPVLFYLFTKQNIADPVVWSVGSSLFCTFIAALSSVARQFQQQNFYLTEGALLGVLGACGVYIGRLVLTSGYYREQEFAIFFSLLLVYVAYRFLKRTRVSERIATEIAERPALGIVFKRSIWTGIIGGFVASLAGIGGGSVMVPIMNLQYHIPIKKAVSISSTAIVLISLSGWLQLGLMTPADVSISRFSMGYVDFGTATPLVLGGILGGFVGAWISGIISQKLLKWLFSALAIAITIKMLSSVF